MSSNPNTSDRLLLAAIDLMAEKGYDGTTTKEIALAAGVNEVTLFRHFGTKQKLLEAAFNRYHYAEEMTKLFNESLIWELHSDLLTISRTYHRIMNRNRKLIFIAQRGSSSLPEEVYREAGRHPKHLKNLLTRYLITMAEQGKVLTTNPEMQALSFMWMNYGAFISSLHEQDPTPEGSLNEFIEESVRLFSRALTP
ncbi:TetR/AcrR family transcriptional regulator [Paenibacillus caui]|uniref:TetR/AcrR family transcriptional regulator n=1 Tax=Paenibacillus caui TaxID=2873927 RepID=UPI001CA978D8|nr:TetR/AcrR family transcriptional regulator [Paenibacillus caui]